MKPIILVAGITASWESNLIFSVIKDGTVTAGKNFKSTLRTISTSTSTGTTGEICYDANFIYICVNTNTWKRVAIASW